MKTKRSFIKSTATMLIIFLLLFILHFFYAISDVVREREIDKNSVNNNFIVLEYIFNNIKKGRLREITYLESHFDRVAELFNYRYDRVVEEKKIIEFVSNVFSSLQYFYSLDLIDANGQEILKLNKNFENEINVIDKKEYKNVKNRDFFQDAKNLEKNEIGVCKADSVSLNKDLEHYTKNSYIKKIFYKDELLGVVKLSYYPKDYFDILSYFSINFEDRSYILFGDGDGFLFNKNFKSKSNVQNFKFNNFYPKVWDKILSSPEQTGVVIGNFEAFYFFKDKDITESNLKEVKAEELIFVFQIMKNNSTYCNKNILLCVLNYLLVEKLALNILVIITGLLLNFAFVTFIDLFVTRRYLEQKRIDDEKFAIVLKQVGEVVFDWDYVSDKIFFTEDFYQYFGFHPPSNNFKEEILNTKYLPDEYRDSIFSNVKKIEEGMSEATFVIQIIGRNNLVLWAKISATAVYDDKQNLVRIVGIILDVTKDVEKERQLIQKAETDDLSGLFNKKTFEDIVKKYLSINEKERTSAYLIFIDIDNFKIYNDKYNHHIGDRVIKFIGKILLNFVGNLGICGRIGGDEFGIYLSNCSEKVLHDVLNKIKVNLAGGIKIREEKFNLSVKCSVGVVKYPDNGGTYKELIKLADLTMYNVKKSGKDSIKFYGKS